MQVLSRRRCWTEDAGEAMTIVSSAPLIPRVVEVYAC